MGNETSCCTTSGESQEPKNMTVEEIINCRKLQRINHGDSLELRKSDDLTVGTNVAFEAKNIGRIQEKYSSKETASTPQFGAVVERESVKLQDGGVYSGQWLGEKKHGLGTLKYADGAIYQGILFVRSRQFC